MMMMNLWSAPKIHARGTVQIGGQPCCRIKIDDDEDDDDDDDDVVVVVFLS